MSIGRFAAMTGLSQSALRYYDTHDVLAPATVDESSGYRWYAPEQIPPARVLARLRKVGMPPAEMRTVIAPHATPEHIEAILHEHVRRLEAGLEDARSELAAVREQLVQPASHVTCTLPAGDLVGLIDAVAFASAEDTDYLGLDAVLLHLHGSRLTLVASDRYRLAVATTRLTTDPAADDIDVRTAATRTDLDMLRGLDAAQPVTVTLGRDALTIRTPEQTWYPATRQVAFADYEAQLTWIGEHEATGNVTRVRERVATSADAHVDIAGTDGRLIETTTASGAGAHIATLNRQFLLDALEGHDGDDVLVRYSGPAHPLAIRFAGNPGQYSILMPILER